MLQSKSPLPDHLPILDATEDETLSGLPGRSGGAYVEPEITEPVDLCLPDGRLDRAAVGWSRRPLTRANLRGHWPRKKRWNFWNWISPDFVLSVTLADIDFASFCAFFFVDFESGEKIDGMSPGLPRRFALPEHVEATVGYRGGGIEYTNVNRGDELAVNFEASARGGRRISAEFVVQRPPGHESLNIVVPWTRERFQLNSKHNTLPCEGRITIDGRRYAMEPERCHAVQDFGRGIWPHRAFWNWGVATGVQDGERVGINVGARWTTRTGVNENGILLDGRLHKIMEDLAWEYDPSDPTAPWRVRTRHSDVLDITLRPRYVHRSQLNLGLVASGGFCAFGDWTGVVRVGGRSLAIERIVGWAESSPIAGNTSQEEEPDMVESPNSLGAEPVRSVLERLHAGARGDRLRFLTLAPSLLVGWIRRKPLFETLTPEAMKDFYIPVSRECGEFLYLTVRALRARHVVEFGTSFGISTTYLAAGVRDNGGGLVIGSEIEPSKHSVATANLKEAGLADQADVRLGDALQTLKEVPEPVDLVFLDGWKDLYIPVLELLTPRLRMGAVVVADNIHTFRSSLRPYVEHVQSGAHGFASTTLSLGEGFEYSVCVGG